jgi:exosortase/archaeosortase family protein
MLLALTACLRLAGQSLAIDTISAFALVVDVYALGRLAGLDRRARAVSPFWLALAFSFALPLERIAQRLVGYPLQELSAKGACGILSAVFGDVTCEGVRINVEGADVMVDLPCSGARALLIFLFFFAALAALVRPRPLAAIMGAALALAAAALGNLMRIALLAGGVALGPETLGFDVMQEPWHNLAGLAALGLAAPIVLLWARFAATGEKVPAPRAQVSAARTMFTIAPRLSTGASLAFLLLSVGIVLAPRTPVDVAAADIETVLPERVGAYRARSLALAPRERAYFEQYGGSAAKAAYGPFALLLVRTNAPLRHLHAPDACLGGMGFKVDYLGLRFEPIPTALYRATAPDGQVYRVETSYVSDGGRTAASVAEAVWRWLSDRSSVWTAIERITPENADARERAAFELAVIAALDAPRTARLETRNCATRRSCAPQGAQSKEREGERT